MARKVDGSGVHQPPGEPAPQSLLEEDNAPDLADEQRHDTDSKIKIDLRAQSNSGLMIGQLFEAVQRHSGAPMSRDWVEQQTAGYLSIGNGKKAAALLEDNRVLVLVADQPGSGRWTAGLHLLSTVPENPIVIRRIRRESGDSFNMDGLRGNENTGWILDLRDPEESIPEKCDLGLELLQNQDLRADNSYLVVLVGTALWERIGHGAVSLALTPDPPNSIQLFTELLRSSGVNNPEQWARDHRFKPKIERLLPGQVWEWARVVALSYSQYEKSKGYKVGDPGTEGFEEVAKAAGNAVSGWMDVLAGWHSAPGRISYERNYLLLTAVLDGAQIDGVHRHITSLAQAFGESKEDARPPKGQQGPGLIQLARQIGAVPLHGGGLQFPGPGFAEAVVQYFWRDRPELTDAFIRWTAQLPLDLKSAHGERLAERMVPWVVHHAQATRSTRLLRTVATDWSEGGVLVQYAQELLVAASLDPQIGHRTRTALGTWINDAGTEAPLLKALARVCQRLAPAHPTQMLRRLGDLALSTQEGVSEAVVEAIDVLWNDADLRPRLHRTLISWFNDEQETPRQSAVSAFLHLARQGDDEKQLVLLRELEATNGDWVIRGWRTVLEADEPTDLARQACSVWLDVAALHEGAREQIITVLVRAVHDTPSDRLRGRRFLNLGRLADHWLSHGQVLDKEARSAYRKKLIDCTEAADPYLSRSQEDYGSTGA
ncbi:hypothetical protein AB0M72_22230 [Nocardiopsis dassonvillei]